MRAQTDAVLAREYERLGAGGPGLLRMSAELAQIEAALGDADQAARRLYSALTRHPLAPMAPLDAISVLRARILTRFAQGRAAEAERLAREGHFGPCSACRDAYLARAFDAREPRTRRSPPTSATSPPPAHAVGSTRPSSPAPTGASASCTRRVGTCAAHYSVTATSPSCGRVPTLRSSRRRGGAAAHPAPPGHDGLTRDCRMPRRCRDRTIPPRNNPWHARRHLPRAEPSTSLTPTA